jgi:26S proteasome regulatory subunit N1
MRHNAEVEAVDLCMETSRLSLLLEPSMVEESSHARVCLYLMKCADYMGDKEEVVEAIHVAYKLYLQFKQYPDALRIALRAGGKELDARIREVFQACDDSGIKKQMGFILGRQRTNFIAHDDAVDAAIGNHDLPRYYAHLAKDMDVEAPKTPEDIYKTSVNRRGAADAEQVRCHRIPAQRLYTGVVIQSR